MERITVAANHDEAEDETFDEIVERVRSLPGFGLIESLTLEDHDDRPE